jgi:predicted MFS family arabinose efflux permease
MDRRSLAVALAGFCTFINLYTPQAILPELADTFGVSRPETGLTITASLLAVALVAPFVGFVSDVMGRKRLIVGACLGVVVPTVLVAQAGTFDAMLAWRFVQGLMLPFIFAVTVAYIGDECEGAAAIRTAGTYTLGTIIGGFSGRFIAGVATDFLGWRASFLVLAAITGAGACGVALFLPRELRFRPFAGGLRGTLALYGGHVANVRLLATCAIGFGMLFSVVSTFTYVNFYLAAPPFGLTPGQLASVFGVYLLGIVTTSFATRIAVRIGRRRTLILSVAVTAAGLLLTLVPALPAVIAGLAFAAAGLFVVQALSLGFIGTIVRSGKSSAVGLYVTLYYIGGSLGGVVPSPLWAAFGWPGVIAVIAVVLSMMAAMATLFWREAG